MQSVPGKAEPRLELSFFHVLHPEGDSLFGQVNWQSIVNHNPLYFSVTSIMICISTFRYFFFSYVLYFKLSSYRIVRESAVFRILSISVTFAGFEWGSGPASCQFRSGGLYLMSVVCSAILHDVFPLERLPYFSFKTLCGDFLCQVAWLYYFSCFVP